MAYCDIWSDTWSSWESRVSDFRLFLYCYTHVMQCNTVHELVFYLHLLPPKKSVGIFLKRLKKSNQDGLCDNLKWVFKAKDICFAFNCTVRHYEIKNRHLFYRLIVFRDFSAQLYCHSTVLSCTIFVQTKGIFWNLLTCVHKMVE